MSNTVSLNKRKLKDSVFGYACLPTFGQFNVSDGGFSVIVYKCGILEYREYIFDENLKIEKLYDISRIVNELILVLESYKKKIHSLDKSVNNGSLDGSFNNFLFYNKWVCTLNISYNNIEQIKTDNPQYYSNYLKCMKQENTILSIFNQICLILKSTGIELALDYIKFNEPLV